MPDPTTNYNWDLPNNGADRTTWGVKINVIFNDLDGLVWGSMPRDGSRSMSGRLTLATTSAALAPLLIPSGSADPTSPAAGWLWNNGHRLKYRNASTTRSIAFLDDDSTGNSATADKWKTPRTFTFTGGATGSTTVDGSENESFALTLDPASVRAVALPPGAVSAFAMNTAPAGWLECDGAAVSRATYASLFAAIGTTFGAGDGTTTFNLPDLRGEFVRGWDHGRGVDSGRTFGSWIADAIKTFTVSIQSKRTSSARGDSGALDSFTGTTDGGLYNTTVTGANETRPRSVALLYAIKT